MGVSTRAQGDLTITGNQRTKTEFLHAILDLPETPSKELIRERIQRLRNLDILADAEIDSTNSDWVIRVEEAVTTYPLVGFGGVEGNRWFLLGLSEINLGGKHIQGTAFYRNIDGLHNAYVSSYVPYLRGTRWGGGIELQRYASVEPLFFGDRSYVYEYVNNTAGLLVSRELGYHHRIKAGMTVFQEQYTLDENRSEFVLEPGIPRNANLTKLQGKLIHWLDRTNWYSYERDGFSVEQQFQWINEFYSGYSPFLIYWMDFKFFKRWPGFRGNLAFRGRLGASTNRETPFAPFVLDSQVNIRGSGNRVDRGTAVAVANLEYRYRALDLNQFAIQVVAFSDLGNWRKPGQMLDELVQPNNMVHFVGGGVRWICKKAHQAVLRVDYGVNTMSRKERGIVVGLGQYF